MTFKEFLARVAVKGQAPLPLVHTTQAHFLGSIISDNAIKGIECPVFNGQHLAYFFVARPAYKKRIAQQGIEDWQCPVCFILAPDILTSVARAYPFDSGAFSAGRFPEYITMMERDAFEVGSISDFAEKITSSFFESATSYLACKPKPEHIFESQFNLGVMDSEIRALHKLAAEFHSSSFDDRRVCIEIQSPIDVQLGSGKVLAVVCPISFVQDEKVRSHIVDVWEAEPITYESYPLNFDAYTGLIYERVFSFYRARGLV